MNINSLFHFSFIGTGFATVKIKVIKCNTLYLMIVVTCGPMERSDGMKKALVVAFLVGLLMVSGGSAFALSTVVETIPANTELI